MKKRFYLFFAAALALGSTAVAQNVVDQDVDYDQDAFWTYGTATGETTVIPGGVTVTIKEQVYNFAAFQWEAGEVVNLDNGGVIKFFDNPESEVPVDYDPSYEDVVTHSGGKIPYHWLITGEGNEIYLDSYCTLGGTISGDGDVTIYVSDKSVIDLNALHTINGENVPFTGTIFLKALDGYTADTITFGTTYPGQGLYNGDVVSFNNTSGTNYSTIPFVVDITGLNKPVINLTSTWPAIGNYIGEGEIVADVDNAYKVLRNSQEIPFDVKITSRAGASRSFEMYPGAKTVFNNAVVSPGTYAYLRSTQEIYFNGEEPSFSDLTNRISLRNAGSVFGGKGVVDAELSSNEIRSIVYNAGYPLNTVGNITIKGVYFSNDASKVNQQIIELDFDGENIDQWIITDNFEFCSTRNNFRVALLPGSLDKAPKEGNYKVLNGNISNSDKPSNDTIGAYIYLSEITFPVYNEETEDFTDTIKGTVKNLQDRFPELNQTVGTYVDYYGIEQTVIDGYDGGNARYRKTILFEQPGTGAEETYTEFTKYHENAALLAEDVAAAQAAFLSSAAGAFIPGTDEKAKFADELTVANVSGKDIQYILRPYHYERAFEFLISVSMPTINEESVLLPTGDAPNINTGSVTYNENSERLTSRVIPFVAEAGADTVNYWFDFSYIMQNGIVQLLSDKVPAVDINEPTVNTPATSIATLKKELKLVADRQIYTLDGRRVNNYVKGLNIVTTRYTDGSIETRRVFFAE